MAGYLSFLEECLGFSPGDRLLLAQFHQEIAPRLPDVVETFYAWILRHRHLREILKDDPVVLDRLKRSFREWLDEVLAGDYGPRQIGRHLRIGDTHRRIGLETRYVLAAMALVRHHLEGLRASGPGSEDLSAALNRALTFQTVLLTDGYYTSRVASLEEEGRARQEVESRLRRELDQAEHLATIGRLVAMVAHEVGNPLAGMQGVLEIVRSHLPADSQEWDLLGRVLDRTRELSFLIRDLLVMSRPVEVHPVALPAELFLHELAADLEASRDLEERTLTTRCEPSNLQMTADPGQLRRAVTNLVLNAAHAVGRGGRVDLTARREGDDVWLEVEDDGPGLPPEVMEQLFTPFVTTKKGGTGLGLCIALEIVRRHGGILTADNLPSGGARFRVILPRDGNLPA